MTRVRDSALHDTALHDTVAAARAGDRRATARLLTALENQTPDAAEIARLVKGGDATIVGVTGSPGVGKSTLVSALIAAWRAADLRVAVLAVDPSSPFSGGAILGDRVRMADHALDTGVYIRSVATRGHLGGLAATTGAGVRLLEGLGFDVVVVETVGVGQAEVEIASLADTTLLLLAPGMGDGIQAVKAGVVEIADVYVVNKADRPGADGAVRDLRAMMSLVRREPGEWRQPICTTVAAEGKGVDDLVAAIAKHRDWLAGSDHLALHRRRRAAAEIRARVDAALRERYRVPEALAAAVANGEIDVASAAGRVLGDTE
ncbi:methylmalonyl Co-A mutase-associated GTPase MeaB [Glycomyces sp. TRM65418]|uniref:methylmalonyl Co-A mutase-associated GTPase MeaB n=1 Tax=Glycomyces sp. TRM65418 TaxID=2867006 RepID=UPI001CE59333|nr:methylmalonyl Co-A mutase-associated GTPase MeaB [Glycomyces sp. TRM65418]MCC3765723.1 methylmalonyl Co-A mutase-associated GTPase MeaB [Glycomyces sp. TRM65418]QZD55314.1 methylmalonyl Co-A mutase-associated GTPase MeaB [Glycomyces sp. TRM65418]